MIKNGLEDTLHDAQYVTGKKIDAIWIKHNKQ